MSSARSVSRAIFAVVSALLCICFASAQTTTTSSKKKILSPAATKRIVAGSKRVAGSKSSSSSSARVQNRKVVVTRKLVHGHWVRSTQIMHVDPGPSYQTHPDSERYQQIQQALAQRGFFKGQADGHWGEDSVSAMKQYQTERKIPNDGRISALALISLGLAPNRETAGVKTADIQNPDTIKQ